MAKVKYEMVDPDLASAILAEAKSIYGLKTYISLFSSAGVVLHSDSRVVGAKTENTGL